MFIYYFANVDRSFREIGELYVTLPFEEWAGAAYREGETLRGRLTVNDGHLLAKAVHLAVGDPIEGSRHITIPVTWTATGTPGLFPRLDADLVLAPIGPNTCQVSLRGNYEPPLGAVGKALDRAVFHRIAEASVKGFVDRVSAALEHILADAG